VSAFERFASGYRSAALIVFNTILLLIVINLVLFVIFSALDEAKITPDTKSALSQSGHFYENGTAVDNGKRTPSNLNVFDYRSFEDSMSELEISEMLDEFYDHSQLGFGYQPWSQYGPRVFSGKYLNVALEPNGLAVRRTINPPQTGTGSKTIKIYAFGGSTTFGSGVPDAHTWPSYLSQILNDRARKENLDIRVEVTNYGRVGFYPTQELHLLQDILRSGQRPELLIFLDGVNLGRDDDTPNLTPSYHRIINEAQLGSDRQWQWLPMVRAARSITARFHSPAIPDAGGPEARVQTEQLVERFQQFRSGVLAISDLYGTKPMFFLQPDGHYNYPNHLYGAGKSPSSPRARAEKREFYAAFPKDSGFVDLTGLFAEWGDRKAIMDAAHYSPNFSKFVAQKIADRIDLSELQPAQTDDVRATGTPRRQYP
jgi:lysophospholipase L1-like esterase